MKKKSCALCVHVCREMNEDEETVHRFRCRRYPPQPITFKTESLITVEGNFSNLPPGLSQFISGCMNGQK